MKQLEKKMTEPEYRKLPCLSYSGLSNLDTTPRSIISSNFQMTDALIYGSAVDVLAFDGKKEFDRKFALMSQDTPSWQLQKVLEGVIEEVLASKDDLKELSSNMEDYSDIIQVVAASQEYGKGWKPDTVVRKTIEGAGELFKFTIENKDKLALSPQQYEYATNSVQTLYTHEFTKHLFDEQDGVDIYYQFPIVFQLEVKGKVVHLKSLLDILIINHNNKTIQPKDLKTTGKHVLAFPQSFVQWKYFLQAALYTKAVEKLIADEYPEYKDYTIELFEFVVISSKDPMRPLMYECSHDDIYAGTYGGKTTEGKEVRGYMTLIEHYMWHVENELYDYPYDVYQAKGKLPLNVFEK